MKAYERRAAGKETYFNLDAWDSQIGCWKKSKRQYDSEADARLSACSPGRYRVSKHESGRRIELDPFEVYKLVGSNETGE